MSGAAPNAPLGAGTPEFEALKDDLIARTGLAYYRQRDARLAEILGKRMAETGVGGPEDYRLLLARPGEGRREFHELLSRLTIGESYFFRCPEQFRALRERIIPECMRRRGGERILRIWSAGCATGAEAHSLAIQLSRVFGLRLREWRVSILATDVNPLFLRQAERGRYADWDLRTLDEREREACFTRDGDAWVLRDHFRGMVDFELHNLASDSFPSISRGMADFDVILCRNVLIYFDSDLVERLMRGFRDALAPHGRLLLGPTDPLRAAGRLLAADAPPEAFAFRRDPGSRIRPRTTRPEGVDQGPSDPVGLLPSEQAVEAFGECWQAPAAAGAVPPGEEAGEAPTLDGVRALADGGRWQAAAAGCEALLEDQAEDPECQLLWGLVLEHRGDAELAEAAFTRAAYLDREHALAWYHLGRLQARNGRARRAFRSFRAAARAAEKADPAQWTAEVPPGRVRRMAEIQIEMRE